MWWGHFKKYFFVPSCSLEVPFPPRLSILILEHSLPQFFPVGSMVRKFSWIPQYVKKGFIFESHVNSNCLAAASVGSGCYNKWQQTDGSKNRNWCLIVWGVRSPRSVCQQGWGLGEGSLPHLQIAIFLLCPHIVGRQLASSMSSLHKDTNLGRPDIPF